MKSTLATALLLIIITCVLCACKEDTSKSITATEGLTTGITEKVTECVESTYLEESIIEKCENPDLETLPKESEVGSTDTFSTESTEQQSIAESKVEEDDNKVTEEATEHDDSDNNKTPDDEL